MGLRQSFALVLGIVIIAGALIGYSAAGGFGGAIVCGADHVPGCATWPLPVAGLVWGAFIAGIAALLIWQLRS